MQPPTERGQPSVEETPNLVSFPNKLLKEQIVFFCGESRGKSEDRLMVSPAK